MTTATSEKSLAAEENTPRRGVVDFGKYRLFARLGTGGMADVYLAVAQGAMNVNRLVVIKRLRDEHATDDATREMFLNEARLAARLNHPNVIQTYEAGNERGTFYLAMEYVDGQPLSRLLNTLKRAGKTLEPRLAARICSDALNGLHYAHELRDFDGTALEIVHRDVSPQNLMLTYEGAVKLVDFGIAKAAIGSARTEHGVFKGKIAFMAPEQVTGDKIDRRADIFAAGIVLWECLTGKPLIGDSTPAKTLYNLMNKPIPLASTENPNVPAGLDNVIARALQRDVKDRFQTAKEMRDALEAFIATAGGVSSEEVGNFTKSLFSDTREKVQAQIKAQLTTLSLARTSEAEIGHDLSHTQIRSTGMLIELGDEFGADTASSLSNGSMFRVVSSASNPQPPSTSRKIAIGAWAFVTLLALAVSGLALMRSQRAASPTPPLATTEVPPGTTSAAAVTAAASTATISASTSSVAASASASPVSSTAPVPSPTQAALTGRPTFVPPRQNPTPPVTTSHPTAAASPEAPKASATAATTNKAQESPQGRTFRRDL
ncbi:MAG: serine/threonine protein kinase [Labilithrix sp.]|nr:serine/threonine protein kinase [Labilithrix sp.]